MYISLILTKAKMCDEKEDQKYKERQVTEREKKITGMQIWRKQLRLITWGSVTA